MTDDCPQVILSPVESSTENILMRIEKMKSIIHQEKPDRRQLTSVLQGSVMLRTTIVSVSVTISTDEALLLL